MIGESQTRSSCQILFITLFSSRCTALLCVLQQMLGQTHFLQFFVPETPPMTWGTIGTNSRKEIHTHTHANNMYYDAEEEREIGGIKGINQVTCRELGGRRRHYGPGSIIITTTRRSISILARCSSFQTPFFLDPWDRKSLLVIFEQLRNNKRAAQEHQRL
jgi:hypothetical protein